MGVDFTNRRVVGFKDEADLKKLPQDVQDLLQEDSYISGEDNAEFDEFHVFTDAYSAKGGDFIMAGWGFQSIEFVPIEEAQPPLDKIDILKKYGIDAKVYSFVEQW